MAFIAPIFVKPDYSSVQRKINLSGNQLVVIAVTEGRWGGEVRIHLSAKADGLTEDLPPESPEAEELRAGYEKLPHVKCASIVEEGRASHILVVLKTLEEL